MEGDPAALSILEPIFHALGAITFCIEKEKKSLYHTAGVFASNYLVTLAQQAVDLLTQADLEKNKALIMILRLMQGTLDQMAHCQSPKHALTGPLQRGDLSTIKSHLLSLSDDQQRTLYSLLGNMTIPLTDHDEATTVQLKRALSTIRE